MAENYEVEAGEPEISIVVCGISNEFTFNVCNYDTGKQLGDLVVEEVGIPEYSLIALERVHGDDKCCTKIVPDKTMKAQRIVDGTILYLTIFTLDTMTDVLYEKGEEEDEGREKDINVVLGKDNLMKGYTSAVKGILNDMKSQGYGRLVESFILFVEGYHNLPNDANVFADDMMWRGLSLGDMLLEEMPEEEKDDDTEGEDTEGEDAGTGDVDWCGIREKFLKQEQEAMRDKLFRCLTWYLLRNNNVEIRESLGLPHSVSVTFKVLWDENFEETLEMWIYCHHLYPDLTDMMFELSKSFFEGDRPNDYSVTIRNLETGEVIKDKKEVHERPVMVQGITYGGKLEAEFIREGNPV